MATTDGDTITLALREHSHGLTPKDCAAWEGVHVSVGRVAHKIRHLDAGKDNSQHT